jgi:hypothetical protein
MSTFSDAVTLPVISPSTTTAFAKTSALILPLGPIVRTLSFRSIRPSTWPSSVRSSLPLEEISASHKKNWLDALQSIDDFNPETIFLIGTASLLLSDVLADFDGKRVIVFLPLNEGIEQVKQKNLRSNQIVFVCSSFEENFRANKIFNAYRRIPSSLHVLNVTTLNLLQNQSNFLRAMGLQT